MTTSNPRLRRLGQGALRARHRIHLARRIEHPHRRLGPDDVQLLDGRRPLHVGRHEQRMPALADQPLRQLPGRRRLAGALQAEQQDDARPLARRRQAPFGVAEERQHLVADDLDDLLRRRQAAEHVLPHRPIAHAVDERLDDLEVDVGLEQRQTNLAQRGLDGLGRQPRFAAQRLEDVLEACAEGVEHRSVLAFYIALSCSTANPYRSGRPAGVSNEKPVLHRPGPGIMQTSRRPNQRNRLRATTS